MAKFNPEGLIGQESNQIEEEKKEEVPAAGGKNQQQNLVNKLLRTTKSVS